MNEGDRTIDLIAQAVGILSGYKDTKGAYIVTSDTAKRAILEGLGLEIGSGTSALRTLEELRHRATRPLDTPHYGCRTRTLPCSAKGPYGYRNAGDCGNR